MIRSIKLGMRSAFAFGLVALLTLVLGLNAILQMERVESITGQLVTTDFSAANEAGNLRRDLMALIIQSHRIRTSENATELRELLTEAEVLVRHYQRDSQALSALLPDGPSQAALRSAEQQFQQYQQSFQQLVQHVQAGRSAEARQLQTGTLRQQDDDLMVAIDAVVEQIRTNVAATGQDVERVPDQAQLLLGLGLVIVLLLSALFCLAL
ncbi:MCP four helix bundle domain-containing protein [Alkalimonas mucilaginosa]|uniref:MCP four helix bundle domain-containing protein n=1 Tax=Alkalimonas mucilaginosa TaxID=3057676 RepID=A0ABU7JF95_9GAMM|nr:MCP four helix bundle domain-containing protein [Alkalimonas sp. MEB004]MEE2024361.1 MCP four helix bundle domain-containing protein [Alkalimonas sp. MEB004]